MTQAPNLTTIHQPDITFFGEKLDDQFDRALAEDRDEVDLLIIIGTSLRVSPVAEILSKCSKCHTNCSERSLNIDYCCRSPSPFNTAGRHPVLQRMCTHPQ